MAKMQDDLRGSAIGDKGSFAEEKTLQLEFYHSKFTYLEKMAGRQLFMAVLFRQIPLANGLTIVVNDHTRLYYGEFYHVKLEVLCAVPLADDMEAKNLLGDSVSYRRHLEQMAVPFAETEQVKERLLDHFTAHSITYLSAVNFPARLVAAEMSKVRGRSAHCKVDGYR
jgi:hypothetical protein